MKSERGKPKYLETKLSQCHILLSENAGEE
jgi:hypothetical protein